MTANISHLGWAQAWYTHDSNEKSFFIDNEKELQEVAKKIGVSETAIPEILKDINLNDRKIVIVYVTTPASNYYYGVKKIESLASKIHINVVEMACPNSFGCASMGGQVIVLSAPKDIPEIVVNTESLNVLDEPEYEVWNYKENKQRVDELKAAAPYNENYSGKIYCSVYKGRLSDEEIRQKNWFKKIDPEFKDQAEKTLIASRASRELEKKVQNTYQEVQNRLIRKSYDEIEFASDKSYKEIEFASDKSYKEIETDYTLPIKDIFFAYLCALGVLGALGVVGGAYLAKR